MNARPFLLQALWLCQAGASRCHRLSDAAHERGDLRIMPRSPRAAWAALLQECKATLQRHCCCADAADAHDG